MLGLSNVSKKTVPKSTLSQHFKALREAGLIRSERRGVEMLNTSRCAEIDSRFPGLIAAIINAHIIPGAVPVLMRTRMARSLAGRNYMNFFRGLLRLFEETTGR